MRNRRRRPANALWGWLGCLLIGASTVVCVNRVAADVPEYDARTFHETTAIRGASFSPDENKILFSSDASGVFNAYSISVDGGEATPLTTLTTNAVFAVSYFPEDERFLYTADEGGNELNHLFVRKLDGTDQDLTPGDNVKASFAGWNRTLTYFYAITNERDPKFFDLYHYDASTYEREMVFQNTGGYTAPTVSRDGRWLALGKRNNNADADVFLWDSQTPDAEPVNITPHDGEIDYGTMTFDPTSELLYLSSNEESEFDRVWKYDLATGERTLAAEDKWDVVAMGFSWNGRYRYVGVNADARTRVSITDLQTGKPVEMPDVKNANVSSLHFSRSEQRLAFYMSGDTSPANLYLMDLATGKQRQLTTSLNAAVQQEHLVASETIRYPSFDQLPIPALLYRPHRASASEKVPALVWVHGGPGGQCRVGYNSVLQFLTNHGFAVLAINNRGSSGYGKTFYHLDDKQHGEIDLKDVVYARKYLQGLDWVDGGKIGIIGGSYGGYLVCAALAFEPEVFDVGIDIFGVTNWVRTLESIPPWWASERDSLYAELGDPAKEGERLRRISPLFHGDRIVRPLLVIQGANDPRVLQVESDEMVAAARANGVPVQYIVFPDEGHGFRNKENRISAADAYLEFLERHLRSLQKD